LKKSLALAFLSALLMLLLVGCFKGAGGSGGSADGSDNPSGGADNPSGGADNPPGGAYVFDYTLVADSSFTYAQLTDIAERLAEATGKKFRVGADGGVPYESVVLLGDTTYPLTDTAYKRLDRKYGDEGEGVAAFLVYARDGSIALAYNNAFGRGAGLEALISEAEMLFSSDKGGTLLSDSVQVSSYLSELRERQLKGRLDALSDNIPVGIKEELYKLYSSYDERLYIWLANLFDPDSSTFYYSASGRDTVGYLPDLESTRQAYSFLEASGLLGNYGNKYANLLTDGEKERLTEWIRGLQSPDDGYFYHPQWGTAIKDSRKGRDLKWAKAILTNLNARPYYDTPDGMKGIGAPSAALPRSLGPSTASAVSAVIPAATTSGLPDYLKDTGKWLDYIEDLRLPINSYSAGNTLTSMSNQIKAAGPEFVGIVMDYLTENQNPENGLWEDEVSYRAVNGLMKISELINGVGGKLYHGAEALDSIIKVALMPDFPKDDEHVCSVYNPWVAMNYVLNAAENEAEREGLREIILENATELIRLTREKLAIFKKDDGGFSYLRLHSSANSQGAPVAVPDSVESDLNATGICSTGTLGNMVRALGIVEPIYLYTPEDGEYFVSTLRALGPIIKDYTAPFDGPTERTATFTEGKLDTLYLRNYFGISTSTATSVEELAQMKGQGFNPITDYSVEKDPFDESNKVLKVTALQSREYVLGYTALSPSNQQPAGGCYTLDFRFLYTDILENGDVMQIHFKNSEGKTAVSLRLVADSTKKKLSFIEYNSGGSGTSAVSGVTLPVGEWVRLRLEFYKTGDAQTTMMKILVGLDGGEPVAVADVNAYRKDGLYSKDIVSVQLAHQRTNGSTVYLDDLSLSRTKTEFVPIPERVKDPVATFEKGETEDDFVTNTMANGDITVISYADDPTGAVNRVLKVVGKSGGVSGTGTNVSVTNYKDKDCNVFTLDLKIYLDELASGLKDDIVQIYFNCTDGRMAGFSIRPSGATEAGLCARNSVSGGTGNATIYDFDGNIVKLGVDRWYRLRLEYYLDGEKPIVKIYLGEGGGEPVCVSEQAIWRDATATEIKSVDLLWQKYNTDYTVFIDDLSLFKSSGIFISEEEKQNGEYTPTAEVMQALGGAKGIVALMHDDGYYDSVIALDKLLYKYGLVADVAMIANSVKDEAAATPWYGVLATNRWKITSHSYTHEWWGIEPADGDPSKITDDPEKVQKELIDSQALLREMFPGQRVLTFAYPRFSSIYNKYLYDAEGNYHAEYLKAYLDSPEFRALVAENYIAGRVGDGEISLDGLNSVEWNYHGGTHISAGNLASVKNSIASAAEQGKFLLLYTHKIIQAQKGESVTASGTYIESYYMDELLSVLDERVEDGSIWNAHYEDAVLYMREYAASTVIVSGDENGLFVTLTDTLDNTVYNHPLTVKVAVPSSFDAVKITQNGVEMYAEVVKSGLKRYALVNLVPDAGVATITACSPAEVPAPPTDNPIPTPESPAAVPFEPSVTDFENSESFTHDPATGDLVSADENTVNTFGSGEPGAISGSYAYVSFKPTPDPRDAAGVVMKAVITKGAAKSSTTGALLQNADSEGVTYILEADLCYNSISDGDAAQVSFKNRSSGKMIYSIAIVGVTDGAGNKTISIRENNLEYGIGKNAVLIEGIRVGEFFTLKLEMWRTKVAATTVTRISVNGEPMVEDRTYRNNALIGHVLDFAEIAHQRINTQELLIDNLSFYRDSVDFETAFPDSADPTEPLGKEGFELEDSWVYFTGDAPSKTRIAVTADEGYYKAAIIADPADAANKVLSLNCTKGGGTQASVRVDPDNPSSLGNCAVLKTRLYISSITNTGDTVFSLCSFDGNTQVSGLSFRSVYNANTELLIYRDNAVIKDGEGNNLSLLPGCWYELTLELYNLGDGGAMRLSLAHSGGEVVTVLDFTLDGAPSVDNFRFVFHNGKARGAVLFDDVIFEYAEKEYIKTSTAP